MISPEEAWQKIVPHLQPLAVADRPRKAAAGFVLGRDLSARVDVPGLDVSAMDGYALLPVDGAQRDFEVVATITAGDPPGARLDSGKATRIMTGAPIPSGADRVVPIEDTDRGGERVVVEELPESGAHIRRRAEILRTNDPLLNRGSLLTPGALGLLATHGFVDIPVIQQPKVAILTTGDEVVAPEDDPRPGQLRDSHTDFLCAAASASGADVEALGIVRDDPQAIEERVAAGLKANVLLICGGVSMGEFDLVEGVLEKAGCTFLFDSVAIQPGKPLVAATHERGIVFGLPGNPASAMVSFWLFVRPALRRLRGLVDDYWRGALNGRLIGGLPASKGRDLFLPAEVRFEDHQILVRPLPPRGSHDLAAYGRGTAMVRIPAHSDPSPAGSECQVLPLGDWLATT